MGLLAPTVVGRSAELGVLRAGLAAAATGAGSTILILGEAGVGKTRMLREVRRWCARRGAPALVGRAVESTTVAPFRPVAEALLAAFRAGPVADDPDVAPFRSVLTGLVPDGSTMSVAAPLLHVAEGFLRVARSRGRLGHGVAVLLDDLQWADAETLAVVEYLADNVADEPVMVVVTSRQESVPKQLTALVDRRAARVLPLPRLTVEQTVMMTRACLGDAAVPAEVLSLVVDRADGLPFFIEELLGGLEGDGSLERDSEGWEVRHLSPGRAPTSFAESVRERVTRLPPTGRDVLVDAALLGRLVDPALLETVGDTDASSVAECLGLARQLGLLEASELGLRFRHALTREALLADLPPAQRAEHARRILAALRHDRARLDGDLPEVAADLAEIAGDRAAAADLMTQVGRRALRVGALTSAESALRRARTLGSGSTIELETTELLVATLSAAGRSGDAFAIGEVLLARLGEGDSDQSGNRRRDVHIALAQAATASTDWSLATAHLDRARTLGDPADPVASTRVDALAAGVAIGQLRLDDACQLSAAAVSAALGTDDADLLCEALLVHGRSIWAHDMVAAEPSFHRAAEVARDAGLVHREARALTELGFALAYRTGDPTMLARARTLAGACGAPETEAVAENGLSAAAWYVADVDAIERHALAALVLARRFRLGLLVASSLIKLACAPALRGDVEAAETILAEAEPLAAGQPTEQMAIHAHVRACCALARDEIGVAVTELTTAAAIACSARTATPPLVGLAALCTVTTGGDASALVTTFRERGFDRGHLWAPLLAAAEATARADGAGVSAALADLARNPFVQAVVARLAGPVAVAGGWGEPTCWLSDAAEVFDGRGLPAAAGACRREVRRAGRPPDELTPREREVLDLVADGLANRTIAERLFLSSRTVEKHVERLLAKTRSANRAQLATYALRAHLDGRRT